MIINEVSNKSFVVFLAFCLTATAHAQNWPSFRGPQASGVADGQALPTAWDAEKSVNILDDCQVKVPSPVIAHELFFLSGGNPRGREFYVVRPNASGEISLPKDQQSSASIAWRKSRGSPYTPTPIVYGDHLYICNDNGVLTVYNAKTGEQICVHRSGSRDAPSRIAHRS